MRNFEEQVSSLMRSAVKIGVEKWHSKGDSVFTDDYHDGDKVCSDQVAECLRTEGKSMYAEFIAKANPALIMCLLAKMEADKALIAKLQQIGTDLEKRLRETEETMIAATDMVSELEARTLTVKLPEAATEGGKGYRQKAIWVLSEACAAAGINLEIKQ